MADKKKTKITQCVKQTIPSIDDDWLDMFVGELAENLPNIHCGPDIQRLCQDTVDSLELKKDQTGKLFAKLLEAKLVTAPKDANSEAPAPEASSDGPNDKCPDSKIKKHFAKELDARTDRDGHGITNRMFDCEHKWDGAGSGAGQKCQVCGFETSNKVWGCFHGCGIALCGSCMFKWRQKME